MRSECFFGSVCLLSPHQKSAPWNWAKGFVYCLVCVLRICLSSCVFLIYKEFTVRFQDAFYFLTIFLFGLWEFQTNIQSNLVILTPIIPSTSLPRSSTISHPNSCPLLHNSLNPVSAASMHVYTGPSTEEWTTYQGPYPWRNRLFPSRVSSADNSFLG